MRDVLLITDSNYGFNEFEKILKLNFLNAEIIRGNDFLLVEFKKPGEFFGERVQIEEAPDVEQFQEPNDLIKIKQIIKHPIYYFVQFRDIECGKLVIQLLANKDNTFVDNDFGLVTSGKEFVKMCESRPGWDWSTE